MKTKAFTHPLAAVAGGLLLAVSTVSWASGGGGLPACERKLAKCEKTLSQCKRSRNHWKSKAQECLEQPKMTFPGDGWPQEADPSGGVPLSYTDNKDGTFTDDNTGLMWEEKLPADDSRCLDSDQDKRDVRCVQNSYTWSATGRAPDGTAFTEFLDALNTEPGLGGYTDWRLPTIKELQSLVDYSVYDPSVASGLPGATAALGLSSLAMYWSSTNFVDYFGYAWGLNFYFGGVGLGSKDADGQVRAVRGGW